MDKDVTYVFEEASASVIYNVFEHDGKPMPKLYVQVIDQYGFQRELTVQRLREHETNECYWEYHVYMHPGRHWFQKCTDLMAKRFVARFLEWCEKHPELLFNPPEVIIETKRFKPRCEGFVRLAEQLHLKVMLNSKLL